MDKILEGVLQSDKPEGLKKQMCRKVEDLGRTTHPTTTVTDIFRTTTRLMLGTVDPLVVDSCKSIYIVWGKNNRAGLEGYFTAAVLHELLDEKVPNQKDAMWVIHETMVLIRSDKPHFLQLCMIIELKAINFVRQYPGFETVSALCRYLFDFRDCIPKGVHRPTFCTSIISAAGTFTAPKTAALMKVYIRDVTNVVGSLLELVWQDPDQTVIGKSLEQLFSIISHKNKDLAPSLALAGIVPHIPVQYIDSIVKQTVSDANIADDNMKVALGRMINWLSWPGAKNLDTWIIAFFRGLAAVHKYTILMDVTETRIVEVFQKLEFRVVRESAFEVLSHMLLSFQHSPEPFHKIVQHVPNTINNLLNEKMESSTRLACRMAQLMHCLMAHHGGFPDLYEPILDSLKTLPKPSQEAIKKQLETSSWKSSQKKPVNISTYTSWTRKSETGKTGLVNLGNTCYMNSVVQALFMCDGFRRDVLAACATNHNSLLLRLQHVFAFLSYSQRAAHAPTSLYDTSRPPWFTAGYQQDCSEYLRYIYDQLHEQELTEQRGASAKPVTGKETGMEVDVSKPSDQVTFRAGPTLIQKTFSGKMVTTFRCLSCHNESSHSEMFTDLPLAFPENLNGKASSGRSTRSVNQKSSLAGGSGTGKASHQKNEQGKGEESKEKVIELEELLHHYLKPEKLDGDNKYHCDMCKGLRDGERVIRITGAPEYLNLTLLRFAYNVKAKSRSKIFTEVAYPKTLHLPVVDRDSHTSGAYTGTRGKVKKSKSDVMALHGHYEKYALCAVIVHSGYSSDSGHYYCYTRHSIPVSQGAPANKFPQLQSNHKADRSDLSASQDGTDFLQDRWYLFNDSRVTYSSYESFSNVTKKFGKDTAYVLFYKRIPRENQTAVETVDANESIMTAQVDPPLRSELRAAVDKDNRLYLQEQEVQQKSRNFQASSNMNSTHYYDWKDHDDNGPPGSCGGGGGGGFSTNRLVF